MKKSLRPLSIFFNLILFMGLAAIWIAFAPSRLGGQAAYVMVNGISMEPNYHTGDLVIVRKAQTYQVGDVVTYRDSFLGVYIIHRIIAIEQDNYIFKGDNNSWIDTYHPTRDELIGKLWIYVPKLGKVMKWLRSPINMGLIMGLLGGILMASMLTKPKQNGKEQNKASGNFGGMLEGGLYLLGFFVLTFLALSIFAFTKPLTRAADSIKYQQDGNYTYSATGTPGVYDTEIIRTGEPVFPKLTCFLNIGFTYNLLGSQLQGISGTHQMYARVIDSQSGWQRTIPLVSQTAFAGNSYFSMATLDLCQTTSLLDLVEKETGLRAGTYTIEIITNVGVTAIASGQPITDTFDPTLAFKFDKAHLYLATTSAESDSMHITKEGLANSSTMQANTLSILSWEPTIYLIRVFALLGLGISLSGLIILGLFILKTANQSEDALIQLRYGPMLVKVYERSLEPTLTTIDVTSMDDLVKLAERQGTTILHMTSNFLHYYFVQNNGTTYRYIISTGKKGIAESDSTRSKSVTATANIIEEDYIPTPEPMRAKHRMSANKKNNGRTRSTQNKIPDPIVNPPPQKNLQTDKWLVAEEIPEYVIHTGKIEFTAPRQETEMLRKIKL